MKKDVQNYFIQMQKQYNELNKMLDKVNKEIEQGLVTAEQKANFENYYMAVKANYDRVAYILHLLYQPPKFIQKLRNKKALKEQEKARKEFEKNKATLAEVTQENEETLAKIKDEFPGECQCQSENL